jgi:hypothetical protein
MPVLQSADTEFKNKNKGKEIADAICVKTRKADVDRIVQDFSYAMRIGRQAL